MLKWICPRGLLFNVRPAVGYIVGIGSMKYWCIVLIAQPYLLSLWRSNVSPALELCWDIVNIVYCSRIVCDDLLRQWVRWWNATSATMHLIIQLDIKYCNFISLFFAYNCSAMVGFWTILGTTITMYIRKGLLHLKKLFVSIGVGILIDVF